MPKIERPPLPQRLHEAWTIAARKVIKDRKLSGFVPSWEELEDWKREGYLLFAIELIRAGVIKP